MPRSVAIVLTSDFSSELENLAFRVPVWLADTQENRAAAEIALHSTAEWPHVSVTLFRPPAGIPQRSDWKAILDQISLREKTIESMEIIGAEAGPAAREAFIEAGFLRIETTASGFRARR